MFLEALVHSRQTTVTAASKPFGAVPNGGPGTQSGRNWQPQRKVDATPLAQTIRATVSAPAVGGAPRKVQIAEDKSFPWVAVGLGALILVAAAVVLATTGILNVNLPF